MSTHSREQVKMQILTCKVGWPGEISRRTVIIETDKSSAPNVAGNLLQHDAGGTWTWTALHGMSLRTVLQSTSLKRSKMGRDS